MEQENQTVEKRSDQPERCERRGISRRGFLIGAGALGAGAALGFPSLRRRGGAAFAAGGEGDADFIVVGSGQNSLSCAMVLSKAGHKVVILEGAQQIGGAAKTAEVTLPGFKHDLYATNIGLFLGGPTFQNFKQDLLGLGFKPVVSDTPMASVFPDQTGLMIYKDREKTYNTWKAVSQKDADAWLEWLAYFGKTAPLFLPVLQQPMPSLTALRQVWSLAWKLGVRGSYDLLQMLLKSPREFCEYWFEHPKSRALVIPWAMHLDFGPDVSGGATFPFVEPPSYQAFGMPLSEGGIGKMTQAMADYVRKRGGAIRTGEKVEKILVVKGKAVGVVTASGQKLYASKAVVANVTPRQMIGGLLDPQDLPSAYVTKCEKYRFAPGTMMIHLALDSPVKWAAGEEFGRFNYVHVAPYVEDLARTYAEAMNGLLPTSPLLVVGQLSVTDPTRVPAGKALLWVQVRVLPSRPRGDAVSGSGAITPGPWPQIKEAYADRVLAKLEEYAPGLSGKILKRTVLSPADLEGDDPNLVGGDSLGGSHHLDQFYMLRPFPGWSRYATPVKGLYMVGASTWPGAGVHGTSGYLLGQELLDEY